MPPHPATPPTPGSAPGSEPETGIGGDPPPTPSDQGTNDTAGEHPERLSGDSPPVPGNPASEPGPGIGGRPATVLVVHVDADEHLARTALVEPLRAAGFRVFHGGDVLVGESPQVEVGKVLERGGPVVICGTLRSAGSTTVSFSAQPFVALSSLAANRKNR